MLPTENVHFLYINHRFSKNKAHVDSHEVHGKSYSDIVRQEGVEVRQHFPNKLAELTMLTSPDHLWTMVCMPSTVASSIRERGAQRDPDLCARARAAS